MKFANTAVTKINCVANRINEMIISMLSLLFRLITCFFVIIVNKYSLRSRVDDLLYFTLVYTFTF